MRSGLHFLTFNRNFILLNDARKYSMQRLLFYRTWKTESDSRRWYATRWITCVWIRLMNGALFVESDLIHRFNVHHVLHQLLMGLRPVSTNYVKNTFNPWVNLSMKFNHLANLLKGWSAMRFLDFGIFGFLENWGFIFNEPIYYLINHLLVMTTRWLILWNRT